MDDFNNEKHTPELQKAQRNFIRTGDVYGNKGAVYHKRNPEEVDDPETYKSMRDVKRIQGGDEDNPHSDFYKNWNNVNHSIRGRVGRAAGMAAAKGYLGYQTLKNKFKR